MNKTVFACDLDNTLIRSFRKKKDGDICIEWIHEKEQGYIGGNAYKMISQLNSAVMTVPVTTRSVEQYLRICWPKGESPRYAVTTNGAVLLDNGSVNPEWDARSRREADRFRPEMERIMKCLLSEDDYIPWEELADRIPDYIRAELSKIL